MPFTVQEGGFSLFLAGLADTEIFVGCEVGGLDSWAAVASEGGLGGKCTGKVRRPSRSGQGLTAALELAPGEQDCYEHPDGMERGVTLSFGGWEGAGSVCFCREG